MSIMNRDQNKQTYQVAPSILSADFSRLKEEVQAIERAGADRLHIDIMDGHFVPQLTIGTPVVNALRKVSALPMDLHFMVQEPEKFISGFDLLTGDSMTVHIESLSDPLSVLQKIQQKGLLAGISLKPKTNLKTIFPFLEKIDIILIMTVEPGFSGQKLLPDQVVKISQLREELKRKNLTAQIHVDGGVNSENAHQLKGADVLVSGNFIFKHESYKEAVQLLKGK